MSGISASNIMYSLDLKGTNDRHCRARRCLDDEDNEASVMQTEGASELGIMPMMLRR